MALSDTGTSKLDSDYVLMGREVDDEVRVEVNASGSSTEEGGKREKRRTGSALSLGRLGFR